MVRPGLTAADEGKNDASTTNRFGMSCVRQYGSSTDDGRVVPEHERAALVRGVLGAVRRRHDLPCAKAPQHACGLDDELLVGSHVVGRVVQANAAVFGERDAVVITGQILGHGEPVHTARHPRVVRPHRHPGDAAREPRVADDLRHQAMRAALRLDLSERVRNARAAQVEIVHRDSLLEHRRVDAERMEALHHGRQVGHVASSDESGRIGEAPWMLRRSPSAGAGSPS